MSRSAIVAVGVAVVVIVGVAVGVLATGGSSGHAATTSADGASGHGGGSSSTTAPPPLTVLSVSPAAGVTNVAPTTPIVISFSQPLAKDSPTPTLSPAVAGTWSVSGATMTFRPSGGYLPYSTEKISVPASVTTAHTKHDRAVTLASADTASFGVANGSELRVEQMLAELNYLPVSFVSTEAASAAAAASPTTSSTTAPTSSSTAAGAASTAASSSTTSSTTAATTSTTAAANPTLATLDEESTQADAVATTPVAGSFTWRFSNTPSSLTSLWTAGSHSVIDQGAIMAFESVHGMTTDGLAGPEVWAALVKAVAARQATNSPYDYLVANKEEPESLTVWQNGSDIYSSPANTGVAAAPTPDGTWPVFERAASTTMTGQNPDGTTYNDPDIPWVAYFHGGDAVHGFNRGSYGVPQSVGCVELPESNAGVVWKYDPLGTLVTVE